MIVNKFGESNLRLKKLIEDNLSNLDVLELILVIIGNFCSRNGTELFSNFFIEMIQVLGEKKILQSSKIFEIVLHIPTSKSFNIGAKEDRLRNLLTSVYHLTTEVVVMMPTYACNLLGENFFLDMKSLGNVPSMKVLKADSSFEMFDEGIQRFKVTFFMFNLDE